MQQFLLKQQLKNIWKFFILVLLAFFVLVFERNQFQKLEVTLRNLLKEQRKLEEEIVPLMLEDRLLNRQERVQGLAKKELKMQQTKPKQLFIIEK